MKSPPTEHFFPETAGPRNNLPIEDLTAAGFFGRAVLEMRSRIPGGPCRTLGLASTLHTDRVCGGTIPLRVLSRWWVDVSGAYGENGEPESQKAFLCFHGAYGIEHGLEDIRKKLWAAKSGLAVALTRSRGTLSLGLAPLFWQAQTGRVATFYVGGFSQIIRRGEIHK